MSDVISTLFSSNTPAKRSNNASSIAIICAMVAIFTSCYSIHLSTANHEKSRQILMQEIEGLRVRQFESSQQMEQQGTHLFRRSVFQGKATRKPVSRAQTH